MLFEKQTIEDVILITPQVFEDERGFFMETYKKSEFVKNGIYEEFNQDNHSKSSKGVLRGLHYQTEPYAQAKIVRCIKGKILDVAVDIRKYSDTFGKYVKAELTEENKQMFYIPKGFAHGFLVLSEEAEIAYKASGEYSQEHDRGLLWSDETVNINWGIDFEPIVSDKDKNQPRLKEIMQ